MSFETFALTEAGFAFAYLLAIASVAIGLVPMTPDRLIVAQSCLVGACIIFAGVAIVWGCSTNFFWLARLAIVGGLSATAAIAAVESFRFLALFTHSESHVVAPNISFQKYAVFWVKIDDDVYQLGVVAKFFNFDPNPYPLKAITYDPGQPNMIGRGSRYFGPVFIPPNRSLVVQDTYLKPSTETYFKLLLPPKFQAGQGSGDMPDIILRGRWMIFVGEASLAVNAPLYTTYGPAISRQDWDDLLKPKSQINIENLNYQSIPAPPALTGPDRNYLLYNIDKTATVANNLSFAETPPVKGQSGIMIFIRGRGDPPLDGGWIVLGHTYNEVWADPERLKLYNSLYPPGPDGKPRPFGVFAGADDEMIGKPAPQQSVINTMGSVSGNQGIVTQGQTGNNSR